MVNNKNTMDIVVLKFSDSKIPEFIERSNKDYILCGESNDYPEYLIYQYNKCGKHRAIINGKSKYILGDGLQGLGGWALSEVEGETVPAKPVNVHGETMNEVLQKSIKDVEIHGGFRWFITVDKSGKPTDIQHCEFYKLRTAKPVESVDQLTKEKITKRGYWFKDRWIKANGYENIKEDAVYYPEWNGKGDPNVGTYVFAYNEYGPGTDHYPLPEYVGCANYIDLDIEISKFHLSSIRNGMMPSKMIQFYSGDPGEEKKKEIEKRFSQKFAGSENAGKFVLVFNSNKDKQVDVQDLSSGDLDKQFDLLSKTVQQELFTGHQVVSPMLFGVKTEGQLGGSTELRTAYETFINFYAKPKQNNLEKVVNYFGGLMNMGSGYKFKQLDPVGIILDIKDYTDLLPKNFILEKLGVPKQYLEPALPVSVADNTSGNTAEVITQPVQQEVNEHLKNLTGRQSMHLVRIIRQYTTGKINLATAKIQLQSGFGFTDEQIYDMLEIEPEAQGLMVHRQAEIDRVVKPAIGLKFIENQKILNKRILYGVTDEHGNTVNARVSVRKVQDKIKEKMRGLENLITETWA